MKSNTEYTVHQQGASFLPVPDRITPLLNDEQIDSMPI